MVERLLPICVKLFADNFEGTFTPLAVKQWSMMPKQGLVDIEQSIGGYLGLLLGEDDKIPVSCRFSLTRMVRVKSEEEIQ